MENNIKTKVLVPLDGSERSMHSLKWVKDFFDKTTTEITLINIVEIVITDYTISIPFEQLQKESELVLNKAVGELAGYSIEKCTAFGYAGDQILEKAKETKYDMIIMTKSGKKGLSKMVGSVTNKVVRSADVPVLIIPE